MSIEEKAQDLLEENRVVLQPGDWPWEALVVSASGNHYSVSAEEAAMSCTCPARERCAHILAVMVRWEEEEKRMEAMPW